MSLLCAENLSLGYDGKLIVENINFTVNYGDYLCIVGENGSGKSTLLKTLLGLIPPKSGNIAFGDGLCKTDIGYLPQQTEIQRDFPASVSEIVLSGCVNRLGFRVFYNKEEKALAMANIEKMGISHIASSCYRELSGGQQQRVLLARALCAGKKMLFLDEPVSGLDPKATSDMYGIISGLNKNEHVTIIMISHDIAASAVYSSHILHIGHTPLFFGQKKDYLKTSYGRNLNSGYGEGVQ